MSAPSDYRVEITAEQYDKLLRLWDRERVEMDIWTEGAQRILGDDLPKSWRRGDTIKLIVGGKHNESNGTGILA